MTLLIRSDSDPLTVVGSIQNAVRSIDRNQPLFGIQTMEQTLSASLSTRRFIMILAIIFSGVAVVLGTVGVYGVLAYSWTASGSLPSVRRSEPRDPK